MKLTAEDIISLFRNQIAEEKDSFFEDSEILHFFWRAATKLYAEIDHEQSVSEAKFPLYANIEENKNRFRR